MKSRSVSTGSFKTIVFPLYITALLLQGCAEKVVAPQFTADPAAFDYAVGEAAEMQIYLAECSKSGGDTAQQASEAASAWYERNWPQVQVADAAYSQKLADQTITYNNEKIALVAIKLYASIEKNIQIALDPRRHSHGNILDMCSRRIAAYKNGAFDLSRNKNADLYLKSLATSPAARPFKIPSLAGNLVTNSAPGRSQFNLEKAMGDSNCLGGDIMTLRNDWPYEVYGAFCPDNKTLFISCEWGDCKIQ